ncbi:MAG: AI-2E family transporter [Paludibacter sp.]
MNTKPYTLDRVVRLLIGLTIVILLFLLVRKLSNVLLPFILAWLLAYLMQPIVHFFQYKLKFKNRILSISCTLLLFFVSLFAVIYFLAPMVVNEITKLSHLIVLYSRGISVDTFIPPAWQNEMIDYFSHLNIQSVLQDENIMSGLKKLAPQLWNIINGSLDFVLGLTVVFIIFIYLIFILLDYEKINASWFKIIPPAYRTLIAGIMSDLETGMNRYFRGQALVALIVGVLFIIGFSIIGLPLAIIMGLLIGLLTLVPYLKVVLIIPCLGLGLLQSAETGQSYGSILLGIAIVFIIIQILEELILVPRIMGKVTGLNPAVILLSLSIWGALMGMVGMIIALPMTTLIISYYKRYVLKEVLYTTVEKDDNTNIVQNNSEVEV